MATVFFFFETVMSSYEFIWIDSSFAKLTYSRLFFLFRNIVILLDRQRFEVLLRQVKEIGLTLGEVHRVKRRICKIFFKNCCFILEPKVFRTIHLLTTLIDKAKKFPTEQWISLGEMWKWENWINVMKDTIRNWPLRNYHI